MEMVVIQFLTPKFEIQEAVLTLWNLRTNTGATFSTFNVRSNGAEIEIERAGPVRGWLSNLVLRRTADETPTPITLCVFNHDITDEAIHSGKCLVDLASYKELVLRLPRGQGEPISSSVFNITILDSGEPTFDLTANEFGEAALLAKPGQYIVVAAGQRKSIRNVEVADDEGERQIIEFDAID